MIHSIDDLTTRDPSTGSTSLYVPLDFKLVQVFPVSQNNNCIPLRRLCKDSARGLALESIMTSFYILQMYIVSNQ